MFIAHLKENDTKRSPAFCFKTVILHEDELLGRTLVENIPIKDGKAKWIKCLADSNALVYITSIFNRLNDKEIQPRFTHSNLWIESLRDG